MPPELTLGQATLCIVTALPKEIAAARIVFSPINQVNGKSGTIYDLCSIPSIGGQTVVAMTLLTEMGNNLAAAHTINVLNDCENVRDVIMVGIAGAIPCPYDAEKHVRLGDLVVSGKHGVLQFDLGKQENGKPFECRSVPTRPSSILSNAVNQLLSMVEANRHPWETYIDQASIAHPDCKRPDQSVDILDDGKGPIPHPYDPKRRHGAPRLFVGAIASSNHVLKDAAKRDAIVATANHAGHDLRCVEMEGSGVQDATWLARAGYLIIRGTCDYCNEKKSDIWQKHASLIAAAFARCVVEMLPSTPTSIAGPPVRTTGGPQQTNSFGAVESNAQVKVSNFNAISINIQLGYPFFDQLYRRPPDLGNSDMRNTAGGMFTLQEITKGTVSRLYLWTKNRFFNLSAGFRQRVPVKVSENIRLLAFDIQTALSVWDYEQASITASKLDVLVMDSEFRARDGSLLNEVIILTRAHANAVDVGNSRTENHRWRASTLVSQLEGGIWGDATERLPEIRSISASLVNRLKGPGEALRLLEGKNDPYAIRTRVALLLNQQLHAEALAVVDGKEPHEWWCDVAVTTFILNDRMEKAKAIIHWTATLLDKNRYRKCCVRLAEGILMRMMGGHPKGENILPQAVTSSERELLMVAVDSLQPVIQSIRSNNKPASGLDMTALGLFWQTNHLLQNRDAVAEAFRFMSLWTPVPIDVARGVISGYIMAPRDLPEVLRRDHPGNLEANILAIVIESTYFGLHKESFARAKSLVSMADSDAKKEELFRMLQTLWQVLEVPEVTECEDISGPLISHNQLLHAIFEASVALRHDDADAAIAFLDGQKVDSDPYWLQMRANACLKKGLLSDAVDYLLLAAEKTLNPVLLHKAGDIAFQAKRYNTAALCYEKLIVLQTDNLGVRGNLAYIYFFVLEDIEKAASQFRALRHLEPQNLTHTLNLAISLAQLFRPEESLIIYEELCRLKNPPIPAVLGRAQLHHSMGHPDKALASLESFRSHFWEEPPFLLTFMSTAYAAEREDVAHEALKMLNQLQQKGAVKPEMFRSVPQDDALEIFKQSFKQERERTDYLHTEMLRGRMFWVWAEHAYNSSIFWGWRTRTQALEWIGDEPTNRSRFSLYATNSFHAQNLEQGICELRPLESPPTGTNIVADISALITLHQLDLLDLAIEYFGEVLIPAGYLPTVLEDSRHMVLHQRSLKTTTELISKQISNRRISTLAEFENPRENISNVDEYTDAADHQYRLIDIVHPLHAAGIINDAELAGVIQLRSKPSAVDETHPSLTHYKAIIVDLSTMETIARTGLLDAVVGFYKIYITSEANLEVNQRLNAITSMEETRLKHLDLWTRLRNNPRVKFVPHTIPEKMAQNDHDTRDYLSFLAIFIAQETKTSLLADDRVCQAFTLNEMANRPYAAFGTDVLVLRLIADGKLDASRGAKVFQQLMTWRYRFLIPPPEILKAHADLHKGNPPGQALREVAEYVHGCMRDPGLFGGPEKTDLGESMAMRTYMAWLSTISEFIVLVWADASFTPDAATQLTMWTCTELLPSLPIVLNGQVKLILSNTTARLFLSKVLLNTMDQFGEPRMADAMKAVKDGLRLTTEEYHQIVISVLNETAKRSP